MEAICQFVSSGSIHVLFIVNRSETTKTMLHRSHRMDQMGIPKYEIKRASKYFTYLNISLLFIWDSLLNSNVMHALTDSILMRPR